MTDERLRVGAPPACGGEPGAPMIVELPDTTTAEINKKITGLREEGGATGALGWPLARARAGRAPQV